MNYKHEKSGAVINQVSFDHLHPHFQALVEPTDEPETHRINEAGNGLTPLAEDDDEISFTGHAPKESKKKK